MFLFSGFFCVNGSDFIAYESVFSMGETVYSQYVYEGLFPEISFPILHIAGKPGICYSAPIKLMGVVSMRERIKTYYDDVADEVIVHIPAGMPLSQIVVQLLHFLVNRSKEPE